MVRVAGADDAEQLALNIPPHQELRMEHLTDTPALA